MRVANVELGRLTIADDADRRGLDLVIVREVAEHENHCASSHDDSLTEPDIPTPDDAPRTSRTNHAQCVRDT